jgi:hypothetical protein
VKVQTQAFDNANPTDASPSLLSPTMQMSSYAAPMMAAQVIDSSPTDAEAEFPPEAIVNWGNLGKGVRWALAIEGAVALVIYGGWQLWRFWR